jgi:hypothetical protein
VRLPVRAGFFVALCLSVMTLGGCAVFGPVFDWFFGSGPKDPNSPASGLGGFLNFWLPGASAILTGAGGIYAAIRGKNWKKVAVSTFRTINAVSGTGTLKKRLAEVHDKAGVSKLVESALNVIEGPDRTHAPPPEAGGKA